MGSFWSSLISRATAVPWREVPPPLTWVRNGQRFTASDWVAHEPDGVPGPTPSPPFTEGRNFCCEKDLLTLY